MFESMQCLHQQPPRSRVTTPQQNHKHACQHFVLLIASSTFGMPIFYFLCFWLPPDGFWLPAPDPPPFGFGLGLAALPVVGVPWTTSSSDSVVVSPVCSPPLERVCALGVSCLANATLLASVGARRFRAAGGAVDAAAAAGTGGWPFFVRLAGKAAAGCPTAAPPPPTG